jgi:hypothetical protein
MGFTGPFISTRPPFPDTGTQSAKYAFRSSPKLKKHFEVLPYWVWRYTGQYFDNLAGTNKYMTNWGSPPFQLLSGSSVVNTGSSDYAKAFDRFWSGVTKQSGTASMGVTIAEWRSSLTMISARSTQLVTAINSIRKKDFGSLMEALNLSRTDKRGRRVWRDRNPVSFAPGQLLEYTFGWVPLVEDMKAACKVLSSTPELITVYGTSSSVQESDAGSDFSNRPNYVSYGTRIKRRVVLKGDVRINNPNLDLANRLGLVNPVTLAWDLIPYSFLVNQFVGVSQYLNRFTADLGRTVENGMKSERISVLSTRESRAYNENWGYLQDSTTWRENGESFVRQSVSSFDRPTILPQLRLPVTDLLGRAITSTALLLQQLQGRDYREQAEARALMTRLRRGAGPR